MLSNNTVFLKPSLRDLRKQDVWKSANKWDRNVDHLSVENLLSPTLIACEVLCSKSY